MEQPPQAPENSEQDFSARFTAVAMRAMSTREVSEFTRMQDKYNQELITKYSRDGLWDIPEFHFLIGSTPGMGGNPDV